MTEREIYMNLFDVSINTYYNWKKENRPIIELLNKYFSKEELIEFLETKRIKKQEFLKGLSIDEMENSMKSEYNKRILEQIENLKKELI